MTTDTATAIDYAALTDAELNAVAAERVMGWTPVSGDDVPESASSRDAIEPHLKRVWIDNKGEQMACEECGNMPDYSTDYNAAAQLRQEIERRGLWRNFVDELSVVTDAENEDNEKHDTFWSLANATPRQITIAAIRAVEGNTK